jgi:hypothetical protein
MTDISVFGDLTALYSARSRLRKSINYETLDRALKETMGVKQWDVNLWYTLFNETNEKQSAFINSLSGIGWEIIKESPKDVKPIGRPVDYRFVPDIAVQISLSVDYTDEVLIVSDSFDLWRAINSLHRSLDPEKDELKFSLAFFSDGLDNRWWQVLNSKNNFVNFIDLNTILYNT